MEEIVPTKLSWTQPVCDPDWFKDSKDEPHRIVAEYRTWEKCCYCGKPTQSGIYKRVDPTTVPYPAADDD